jgi:hypothetical protein
MELLQLKTWYTWDEIVEYMELYGDAYDELIKLTPIYSDKFNTQWFQDAYPITSIKEINHGIETLIRRFIDDLSHCLLHPYDDVEVDNAEVTKLPRYMEYGFIPKGFRKNATHIVFPEDGCLLLYYSPPPTFHGLHYYSAITTIKG